MNILVTGAAGFVGRHLRGHLEESSGYRAHIHGFDLAYGHDIRNYEDVRLALLQTQPDYVYHLAAQAYVPETSTDIMRGFDVNVGGTLALLEAIRHTGLRPKILLAGTSEEYGYEHPREGNGSLPTITEESPCRPTTPYGVSKLTASLLGTVYARQYGMHVVVTRAFNHIGPGQSPVYAVSAFAKRVAEAEANGDSEIRHGNLSAIRHYLDVRDVVRAYRLVIDAKPGIYNVCGGAVEYTVPMDWILVNLAEMTGKNFKFVLDNKLFRPGGTDFPHTDYSKLNAATGWNPERKLMDTLEEILNYWRVESAR
jgi:GDP-4-dehydro-6-deoxy-D-mannose reductase